MHSQMVIFIFNIDTRFIIYKCFLQYFTLDYKKILPPFSADIQCLLDMNVLTSININIQFSIVLHSSLSSHHTILFPSKLFILRCAIFSNIHQSTKACWTSTSSTLPVTIQYNSELTLEGGQEIQGGESQREGNGEGVLIYSVLGALYSVGI